MIRDRSGEYSKKIQSKIEGYKARDDNLKILKNLKFLKKLLKGPFLNLSNNFFKFITKINVEMSLPCL